MPSLSFEQFIEKLNEEMEKADQKSVKFVTMASAEIERTAKTIMRDSPPNSLITYGKKGHHPSFEGNPPVPDTGTLMRSITHSIRYDGREPVGEVGSLLQNPDYPKFLENGTSKMKPRPWLSTSLIKCQDFMSTLWRELFR